MQSRELFQFRGFNTAMRRANESRNLIKSSNAFRESERENVYSSCSKTPEMILEANIILSLIKALILSARFRQRNIVTGLTSEGLIELREVGENGQSIGHRARRHVLGIQERRDPEMLLGRSESQLVVPVHIVLVQAVEVAVTKSVAGTT